MIVHKSTKHGFSLAEFLIVFGIIAAVAGFVLTSYRTSVGTIALRDTQASAVITFEKAKERAQSSVHNASHGVYVETDSLTLFEGDTYSGSGQVIDLPSSVSTDQSGTEVVFEKLTGKASGAVTITLSNPQGEERGITISNDGIISRQ